MLKKLTPLSSWYDNSRQLHSDSKTICDILYKLRDLASGMKKREKKKKSPIKSRGNLSVSSNLYRELFETVTEPSFEYSNLYLRKEARYGNLRMPKCNFKVKNTDGSTIELDSERLHQYFKAPEPTKEKKGLSQSQGFLRQQKEDVGAFFRNANYSNRKADKAEFHLGQLPENIRNQGVNNPNKGYLNVFKRSNKATILSQNIFKKKPKASNISISSNKSQTHNKKTTNSSKLRSSGSK